MEDIYKLKTNKMGKLGQKIEHIDNATNEIVDEIRNYLMKKYNVYFADDEIYLIIKNKLKEII